MVNSTQMIVLLQLLEFWWIEERSAYPSTATIAERIGMSSKQVQRTVNELAKKNLITRINRHLPKGGKTSNEYKFDGLLKKLNTIEVDFDKARKARKPPPSPEAWRQTTGDLQIGVAQRTERPAHYVPGGWHP